MLKPYLNGQTSFQHSNGSDSFFYGHFRHVRSFMMCVVRVNYIVLNCLHFKMVQEIHVHNIEKWGEPLKQCTKFTRELQTYNLFKWSGSYIHWLNGHLELPFSVNVLTVMPLNAFKCLCLLIYCVFSST